MYTQPLGREPLGELGRVAFQLGDEVGGRVAEGGGPYVVRSFTVLICAMLCERRHRIDHITQ
jgi:hypothetical protein